MVQEMFELTILSVTSILEASSIVSDKRLIADITRNSVIGEDQSYG